MAFHICNELEQKSQVTIICDSTADIATLPNNLCPGSIANAAKTQTDEDALESVWMYDPWDGNHPYEIGDRVRDADKLYKRIQPWTAPEVYPPHEVPALWVEVAPPGEYREIKENPLPTEVFALNEIGWWQTKDNLYKSLINANSYTPVSYPAGWEKV